MAEIILKGEIMERKIMSYDSAMSRFMKAKKKKSDLIKELEVLMKAEYKKETGLEANYFFAM